MGVGSRRTILGIRLSTNAASLGVQREIRQVRDGHDGHTKLSPANLGIDQCQSCKSSSRENLSQIDLAMDKVISFIMYLDHMQSTLVSNALNMDNHHINTAAFNFRARDAVMAFGNCESNSKL